MTQFNFISLILVLAEGAQSTSCEQQSEAAPFKPEGTVPSRLALGGRGAYGTRCWGSPVRQKKKHTGERQWVFLLRQKRTFDATPVFFNFVTKSLQKFIQIHLSASLFLNNFMILPNMIF